jgi:hypothetical protein
MSGVGARQVTRNAAVNFSHRIVDKLGDWQPFYLQLVFRLAGPPFAQEDVSGHAQVRVSVGEGLGL